MQKRCIIHYLEQVCVGVHYFSNNILALLFRIVNAMKRQCHFYLYIEHECDWLKLGSYLVLEGS